MKDGGGDMKCPKCGRDSVTSWKMGDYDPENFGRYNDCEDCDFKWTDWQQEEIERLEAENASLTEENNRIKKGIKFERERMKIEERLLDESRKEKSELQERLEEAERVIDSACTDFCSNMSEYEQKNCMEIPLLEFDYCTNCMAKSYRAKHPK